MFRSEMQSYLYKVLVVLFIRIIPAPTHLSVTDHGLALLIVCLPATSALEPSSTPPPQG
jgi:hypothetical protein